MHIQIIENSIISTLMPTSSCVQTYLTFHLQDLDEHTDAALTPRAHLPHLLLSCGYTHVFGNYYYNAGVSIFACPCVQTIYVGMSSDFR